MARDVSGPIVSASGRPLRATGHGVRLGKLFGIEIQIDPSWLFIFLLVTWNLATAFSQWHPGWGLSLSVATALAASFLFFASVLAHELAHSLVARSRGLSVNRITLFLFGGVSNLEREPASPATEFLMAIVGPLTSVFLGFVFLALGQGLAGRVRLTIGDPLKAFAQLSPLSTLLLWLGPVNIAVGLFNLVPAFPLDGGRILRSILWAATGNLRKATRWASRVGSVIAWWFIVAGIAMIFGASVPFFGTGVIGGLWIAMIGWFLRNAAVSSYQQLVVYDLLEGVPVSRVMRRDISAIPADTAVGRLVEDWLIGTDERAFPVLEGDRFAGLVCLEDLGKVPRVRWDSTPVREIMTPVERLSVLPPQQDAAAALRELTRLGVGQVPVVESGHLVGLLRRRDFVRWLHLQSDLSTV